MAQNFLGQITVFPYSFAPVGWIDCAGQLLSISQYSALFSLLGTTYGGNGTSNFALPDLRGQVPVGQGQLVGGGIYDMGEASGSEGVTLNVTTIPAHNHGLSAIATDGGENTPSGQVLARGAGGTKTKPIAGEIYNAPPPTAALAAGSIGTSGNSSPHNNIQPSLVLRYCIAIQGVFPARQ